MSYHLNDAVAPMNEIVLVGAGSMASAYVQVLKGLGVRFLTVGRDPARARALALETGASVVGGGLASWLEQNQCPKKAIVATGIEDLEETTQRLIQAGCRSILLEKPGALDSAGIRRLAELAAARDVSIWIGFNRRYYASVAAARSLAHEDGGLTSAFFDFTELGYRIAKLGTSSAIKQQWFFANSLHVVDLAFHLIGAPSAIEARVAGGLPWHERAAQFVGSGISRRNVCFSYRADWAAPGRWKVELFTSARRLVLCPLEGLRVQTLGSFEEHEAEIDDALDRSYKPGLYRQVEAWIRDDATLACKIGEMAMLLPLYERMGGYEN